MSQWMANWLCALMLGVAIFGALLAINYKLSMILFELRNDEDDEQRTAD